MVIRMSLTKARLNEHELSSEGTSVGRVLRQRKAGP